VKNFFRSRPPHTTQPPNTKPNHTRATAPADSGVPKKKKKKRDRDVAADPGDDVAADPGDDVAADPARPEGRFAHGAASLAGRPREEADVRA
jgi:hypothetical protein